MGKTKRFVINVYLFYLLYLQWDSLEKLITLFECKKIIHLQHEIYNISRILINSQVWNRKDFYRPAENIWLRKSESLRWVIKIYIYLVYIGKNMHKRIMPEPGWKVWLRFCIWFIVKQVTVLLWFIVKQAAVLLWFIVKQATGLLRFIVNKLQGYSGLL